MTGKPRLTMSHVILGVYVRHSRELIPYVCMRLKDKWKCGRCLRGVFVVMPKKKDVCRVCGAKVCAVLEVN